MSDLDSNYRYQSIGNWLFVMIILPLFGKQIKQFTFDMIYLREQSLTTTGEDKSE